MAKRLKFETVRKPLLDALAVYPTDKAAIASIGVSNQALYSWIRTKPGFRSEVQRARELRQVAIIAKLAKETDWRAWEASLKHAPKVLDRSVYKRKLVAEADLAEAKARRAEAEARAAEAITDGLGEGRMMLVGVDAVLDLLERVKPALRDEVEQALAAAEATSVGARRDLLPQEVEA